jgi:hypothetical protein
MNYQCIFCGYRSDKQNLGCPNCGRKGYAKAGVIKGLQIGQGIVFTLVGGTTLFIGASVLFSELRLPYKMAPWWVFVIIFGGGAIFFAGGISSLCGRSWLLRWLLVIFGRGLV